MRLQSLEEILAQPKAQDWAVPAFDVINHETVQAAMEGSAVERAPVILMILPSHTPQELWPGLVALIQVEAERVGVPTCLQLDHATSLEEVRAALDAVKGFPGTQANDRPIFIKTEHIENGCVGKNDLAFFVKDQYAIRNAV